MLIESLIRRAGGSEIDMVTAKYRFLPRGDGRHVAEVTDRDHIKRLLSITEGFEAVVDEPAADVAAPSGQGSAPPLTDSDREAAAALYQERFGRKPHFRWGVERIMAQIEAGDDGFAEPKPAGNSEPGATAAD